MIAPILFIACIPLANLLIGNVGTTCIPDGPCLIPVAPGIMAPSGVALAGVALVLRDVVHRQHGPWWAVACIMVGALVSVTVAPAALAIASGTAFLLSELADFGVYTPLARKRFMVAVVASSAVGLVVDSAVFLWLAFGSLDYISGQVIAKTYAVVAAVPVLYWLRSRGHAWATEHGT